MTALRYFVTGGTGFLGKELVPRLLARGGHVALLVRSPSRHAATLEAFRSLAKTREATLDVVEGDVGEPSLGLAPADRAKLAGLDHVFHLAGLYDLGAEKESLTRVNVDGTRHVLTLLRELAFRGVLHHASSVAVAGDVKGDFTEAMLDVGQKHPHAYFRSKFESEKLVREATDLRTRIYRPSAIVGHSKTGAMDRVDGPYYLFEPIRRLRAVLPPWMPIPAIDLGPMNIVPVDFVAAAIDVIGHGDGHDGKTFHVVDPKARPFVETFNTFARAAGAPQMRKNPLSAIGSLGGKKKNGGGGLPLGQLASVSFLRKELLLDLGIPPDAERALAGRTRFDATNLLAALEGSGLRVPKPSEYAGVMWDHWHRHLAPEHHRGERRRATLRGKRVLVTGGSSGIGESFGHLAARYGAKVTLVARREDELQRVVEAITAEGGIADYVVADLSTNEGCDAVVETVLARHGYVDVLVNNAGHSIRRSLASALDRFHDVDRLFQINFRAPLRLIRGFLPTMRARKSGTILNVLSAGTHMASPMFGVYTSSKAALSQFSNTLAAELAHENIYVVNAYLPFVRTPMMGATGRFDDTDAMTPERAARYMIDGLANRERLIMPTTFRAFYLANFVAENQSVRVLNLIYRIWADDAGEFPEVALERAFLTNTFKQKWM